MEHWDAGTKRLAARCGWGVQWIAETKHQNIALVCPCFPEASRQTPKQQTQHHMTVFRITLNDCYTNLFGKGTICPSDCSPKNLRSWHHFQIPSYGWDTHKKITHSIRVWIKRISNKIYGEIFVTLYHSRELTTNLKIHICSGVSLFSAFCMSLKVNLIQLFYTCGWNKGVGTLTQQLKALLPHHFQKVQTPPKRVTISSKSGHICEVLSNLDLMKPSI